MQVKLNRFIIAGVIFALLFSGTGIGIASAFWGKDKKERKKIEAIKTKKNTSENQDEDKFVQLASLEESFLNSVRRRRAFAVNILNLQTQLSKTDKEKEKSEIEDQIKQIRKELDILNVAMDVIFHPMQPRQYEYNPVTSTVYVKVGNVEQVFIRAVQLRDMLLKAIQKQEKKHGEVKKDEEKTELQKKIDSLKRQYQTVVASLQIVFDVIPQRNYLYNPKDSTLYLKVTEKEAKQIQEKIDKMSQQASDTDSAGN
ncbi:MAG: hypothetical protein U9O82_02380 [Thermodesulfobacteriota bacterium]|nr:hypothetical protein [Thermodesulfobacteriota bacterium]